MLVNVRDAAHTGGGASSRCRTESLVSHAKGVGCARGATRGAEGVESAGGAAGGGAGRF